LINDNTSVALSKDDIIKLSKLITARTETSEYRASKLRSLTRDKKYQSTVRRQKQAISDFVHNKNKILQE